MKNTKENKNPRKASKQSGFESFFLSPFSVSLMFFC